MTGVADAWVTIPIVAICAITLVIAGEVRAAAWWCLANGLALGGVLLSKLVLIPFGHSPSGHTAAAASVYGCLIVFLVRFRETSETRIFGTLLVLAFVLLIGASRMAIHAHSLMETLAGALCGFVGPALLLWARPPFLRSTPARTSWALVVPVLIGLSFWGEKASIEPMLWDISHQLASSVRDGL